MRLHHRSRIIVLRLGIIFCTTFVGAFLLLNIRFVEKNVQYWVAPGTIRTSDSLQSIRLLPLAEDAQPRELPDQAMLVIDSIGIKAPIVFNVPPDNDMIYQHLSDGVVHYSATAKPGLPGTAVILGHSSAYPWYKGDYGAVFALLGKLKPGDRFYVHYSDDRTFVYQVHQSLIFNPFANDGQLEALENAPGTHLILISCYPVGTNYKRIAVQADLIKL